MSERPAWWPKPEQKLHADAGCSHPDYCNLTADGGAAFDHDPHGYRTPRGKVKACDGSTTKRSGR